MEKRGAPKGFESFYSYPKNGIKDIPKDNDLKKLECFGFKVYSFASRQFQVSNYQALFVK